jgi:hypothetical protein
MYFSKTTIVSFGLLASSPLVAGHGAIIRATGDAGGAGSAIGVVPTTPRDGTNRNPFQQDSTRFRGDAAATCGETLGGGANDVNAGTAQVMQLSGAALPQVSAGGSLMMTVHQVNSDGAGPYKCMIDSTGTGTNWTPVTVTQNLAGNDRGRNRDTQMQDLPLTVQIDAAQTCTGTVAGQSGVCMVRCENPARAGPFGGCVPMQLAGAAAAAPAAAAPAAGAAAPVASAAAPAAAAPAAGAAAPVASAAVPAAAAPAAGAAAPVASAAAPVASAAAGVATDATTGAATDATGAVAGAGAATGATAATTTTNNNLAARRERAAKASKAPALTDDDQEEEIDLLD